MTENFAQQGKFKSMVPDDFLFCPYSTVCVLYSTYLITLSMLGVSVTSHTVYSTYLITLSMLGVEDFRNRFLTPVVEGGGS